ncbi:YbjQ family protein [Lentibacillus sp. CBA3610]|uniref:YbjQ family protein n=1 Tax=Lentibacillus sp. CBA3610 TaxID=2518176 RepID=UPI0015953C6B|nr:YbjQ family protein [Lentibacillus sp. CBA3610]QKY71027.1 YbjQ family protein [Lentibacillus sp. CBA3610]
MMLANTETIPGYEITEFKGLARGNVVRAKNIGKDIVAGLRNVVGGEVTEYTEMLTESRQRAIQRMVQHAEELGADAVVNIRFVTSQVASGAAELLAYGTAVKVQKVQ